MTGNYSTVVKGAYSQYYEGAMASVFERAVPGVFPKLTYDVTGPQPVLIDTINTPIYKIDPNIKHPRVDEVYGALERALGGSMRLTFTGIYRENKNFINSISPNATWTPVTVTNDLTDSPLTLYKWANRAATQSDYLITNVNGYQYRDPSGNVIGTANPFRKYKAFMAVLNKRLSNRWTAQVSYVLSEATGTVDNTSDAQVSSRQFETPVLAFVNVNGHAHQRSHARVQGARQLHDSGDRRVDQCVLAHDQRADLHAVPAVPPRASWGCPDNRARIGVRCSRREARSGILRSGSSISASRRSSRFGGRNRLGVYMQVLNTFNASTITATQNRVPSVSIAGILTSPCCTVRRAPFSPHGRSTSARAGVSKPGRWAGWAGEAGYGLIRPTSPTCHYSQQVSVIDPFVPLEQTRVKSSS